MNHFMPDGRQGILRPDHDQILEHLTMLFGEEIDGTFEIAWTRGRAIDNAKVFNMDDLERAAALAVERNSDAGSNVYIGLTSRQPGTFPDGRTTDGDYYKTLAVAVDLDDEGAFDDARLTYASLNMKPTFAVVTGVIPHTRAQLIYKLEEPFGDPDIHREMMRGLAIKFSGDRSISNPGRVMRLGGTIAWATKPGRQNEMTALHKLSGIEYPTTRLLAVAREAIAAERTIETPTSGLGLVSNVGADIDGILREIKTADGGRWRELALQMTASMVSRGLPDSAILAMAEAMTAEGWTVSQTVADLEKMIEGARQKGYAPTEAPEPPAVIEAKAKQTQAAEGFNIREWDIATRYHGAPPPIDWLIEGVIQRGSPGVVAGMGGIGKSFLALDACIAVANPPAIGTSRVFGNDIHGQGNAIFFTAEDDVDSVHRRIEALDATNRARTHEGRVFVIPLPNQKGVAPIIRNTAMGGLEIAPAFSAVREQINSIPDLAIVAFDPLQAFVQADLNASEVARAWGDLMAELAAETGAAMLTMHHMNKASLQAETLEDARQGIRGNTDIVDSHRMAYVLWKAPKGQADKIAMQLGEDPEKTGVVFGGVVKTNGPQDHRMHTYLRAESGLLVDVTERIREASDGPAVSESLARAIAKEIDAAWSESRPWSMATRAKTDLRYFPDYAIRTWNLDRKTVENLMADWQSNAIVSVEMRDAKSKVRGLRLLRNPW